MIEEAEVQKEIVEKIPELENQKKLIEDRVKKAQVTYEKLLLSKTQIKQSKESIEKLRGEIAILENEIIAGKGVEQIARQLPDLEYQGKNLIEEITIIKTTVQREEKVLSEIQDGLCPLLSQRCLNMKEGERLDTFFTLQVNQEKKRMRGLERQQENISRRIIDAKNALKKSSQLEVQRVHLERCQQDFSIVQNILNNLLNEMTSLPKVENDVQALTQELETLNQELQIAREAQMKYQGLGMLKEQLVRISDEGLQKKSYLNQIREKLSHKKSSEAEKAELESKLITLNDPRGRTKLLHIEINNETAVNASLQLLEEKEAQVQQVITTLSNELEVFFALDEEIAKVREKRAINKKDYEVFIENQPIAALLDARRQELNQIDSELRVIKQDFVQKGEILKDILNIYDDTKRNALSETLEGLLKELATLTAERNAALMRLDELRVEIQRLLGIKQNIEEVNQEKDQNERLLLITEFIREILKNSGPHITEAHLKSISIEANQLYRDITGNPMVSLKWDPGYEIILEDEGFERSFSSLSGGEQMSAALSVRLALLKELSDIRVAFFDEPTTNMDDERRRNLAEQIGRIKDLNQLFIISHDDTFESFTDQLIELKK
jgi:exonuclease SbcC